MLPPIAINTTYQVGVAENQGFHCTQLPTQVFLANRRVSDLTSAFMKVLPLVSQFSPD